MSAWGDLQEETLKNAAVVHIRQQMEEVRGFDAGPIRRHRQELRQLSNPIQRQSQATRGPLHCTKIVQKERSHSLCDSTGARADNRGGGPFFTAISAPHARLTG